MPAGLAPHPEYSGNEEYLQEPVASMDGGELPWPFIPQDRARKDHNRKPDRHPDSELHCVHPADDSSKRDYMCHHKGDNEATKQLEQFLPRRHSPHIGWGVRVLPENFHPPLPKHANPPRAKKKRARRRHETAKIFF